MEQFDEVAMSTILDFEELSALNVAILQARSANASCNKGLELVDVFRSIIH